MELFCKRVAEQAFESSPSDSEHAHKSESATKDLGGTNSQQRMASTEKRHQPRR